MFGSNFPVDSLYSTFARLYAAFDHLTADFTPAERADMFAGTAARAYRIQRTPLSGEKSVLPDTFTTHDK